MLKTIDESSYNFPNYFGIFRFRRIDLQELCDKQSIVCVNHLPQFVRDVGKAFGVFRPLQIKVEDLKSLDKYITPDGKLKDGNHTKSDLFNILVFISKSAPAPIISYSSLLSKGFTIYLTLHLESLTDFLGLFAVEAAQYAADNHDLETRMHMLSGGYSRPANWAFLRMIIEIISKIRINATNKGIAIELFNKHVLWPLQPDADEAGQVKSINANRRRMTWRAVEMSKIAYVRMSIDDIKL